MLDSCQGFVDAVRDFEVSPDDFMVRIDVKHFFMSGSPIQLTDEACKILPHKSRNTGKDNAISKPVLWLLSNQFVSSRIVEGVFQVTKGSGMGLQCSGPIADSVFFNICEKDWATKSSTMLAHGVKFYKRFKDDVFIIADNKILFRKYYQTFKEKRERSSSLRSSPCHAQR